jgi:hypothetical protein
VTDGVGVEGISPAVEMEPERISADVLETAVSNRRIVGVLKQDDRIRVDPCLDVAEGEAGVAEIQTFEMDVGDVGARVDVTL